MCKKGSEEGKFILEWGFTPLIPALWRMRQEDHCECHVSLGYREGLNLKKLKIDKEKLEEEPSSSPLRGNPLGKIFECLWRSRQMSVLKASFPCVMLLGCDPAGKGLFERSQGKVSSHWGCALKETALPLSLFCFLDTLCHTLPSGLTAKNKAVGVVSHRVK